MDSAQEVLDDLRDEQVALDEVVAPLREEHWRLETPSPGWTIAHQVAHLAYFDDAAAVAMRDPEDFARSRDELVAAAMSDPSAMDRITLGARLEMGPADLLGDWRAARSHLLEAAGTLDDDRRIEWYGPSMSQRSFLTARLMETWAHGLDVLDALDAAGVGHVQRTGSERLRHVAHLGVVTRGWSYAVRGREAPGAAVRVELLSPTGGTWSWGPDDAADLIEGPAWDFCAVVTQRRHPGDTDLRITGDDAAEWMSLAQAFAGGPSEGPPPRRHR